MSSTLARLSTVGAAGAAALALFAGPALAASDASLTATGSGAAPAASRPATVVDETAGPAATGSAAASVGFRVFNARCTSTSVQFDADTFETGFSGVQRLQQRAQLQKFTTAGWRNATGVSTATSTRFPNDGRNFHFTRHWNGSHGANGGSWRVKWQGFYFNGGGAVVARTKVILVTCA